MAEGFLNKGRLCHIESVKCYKISMLLYSTRKGYA